jgi:prolyl 4-hydroxylase
MSDADRALDAWLRDSVERGCTVAAMVATMVASGHAEARAVLAVLGACARWRPATLGLGTSSTATTGAGELAVPPIVSAARLVLDGREVGVELVSSSPRLAVLDGLLDTDECAAIVAAAADRVERSRVVDSAATPGYVDDTRTSAGTAFHPGDHPAIDVLQRRLAELVELPASHLEPMQVLRYRHGDAYEPHFDFFADGSAEVSTSQRIATVIVYLAEVAEGGATVFPLAGLSITPRRGRAVYFTYRDGDGAVDETTLHAGAPVVAGEKWIATQWCRDQPYGP